MGNKAALGKNLLQVIRFHFVVTIPQVFHNHIHIPLILETTLRIVHLTEIVNTIELGYNVMKGTEYSVSS
jgi:hypothetical protein